eukprot:TRINITY_DN13157_c0_g2_i1.p1 TRINITY_DN13157_c0_g2~~TRINITY_DN13157_c0_g2_i1.p1  ORF type:complete len:411 (+),score=93.43 TRINITY_DN13157_c0_g2_i1:85-1317(+)
MVLWKIRELLRFSFDLLVVLLGMLRDRVVHGSMPRCIEDLSPALLSSFMGKDVVKVHRRSDREKHMTGDVTDLGAGGTGTCRAWLEVEYRGGGSDHVFVKMPATTLSERLFLTVFNVYQNELNFYMSVRGRLGGCSDKLFAKQHAAVQRGHRFCLVLEDISKRGAEFPSILDPYPREKLNVVLDTLSAMHATFWQKPPQNVWCDEWSMGRTVPPTARPTRPVFRRFVAEHTLKEVTRRYPGAIPDDLLRGYRRFLANSARVRRAWSSGVLTMCHGDSHIGNMFFLDGKSGLYDMQCVAAEHPMRDVTYHLMTSYDRAALAAEETDILKQYLSSLNEKLGAEGIADRLTFDQAWEQYRLQGWWVLTAFAISAGASDLMKEGTATLCLERICTAMKRIDCLGALDTLLAERP